MKLIVQSSSLDGLIKLIQKKILFSDESIRIDGELIYRNGKQWKNYIVVKHKTRFALKYGSIAHRKLPGDKNHLHHSYNKLIKDKLLCEQVKKRDNGRIAK